MSHQFESTKFTPSLNSAQRLVFFHSCLSSCRLILPQCNCGRELRLGVGKMINWAQKWNKHTEENIRANMENLSHYYDHHDRFYIICWSIITVNNKENKKNEEFLSFVQLSIGLFLSGVSDLTTNPGRLWDVTDLSLTHQYGRHIFHLRYPAPRCIMYHFYHFSYKKLLPQKNVRFQLYQWQASGIEHTDKQAKVISFLLDIDTVTIQSPFCLLLLYFSVNEGTKRVMP